MPQTLSPAAQQVWKSTTKLLADRGTLTPSDGPAIAVYAEMTVRYQMALESLTADGLMQAVTVLDSNGRKVKREKLNPMLKVVENCERILQVYLRNLGMTVLTRERAKPLAQEKEENSASSGKHLADILKLWREDEEANERKRNRVN